jgi:hypothetical protein
MTNNSEDLSFLLERWGFNVKEARRLLEADDMLRGLKHGDECAALKDLRSLLANKIKSPKASLDTEALCKIYELVDTIIRKRKEAGRG